MPIDLLLFADKAPGDSKAYLSALYSQPSLNLSIYQETSATYSYVQQGLWDAGNNFVANGREFAAMPSAYRYNFTSMAAWNYLIDNAAVLVPAFEKALDLQVAILHLFKGKSTTTYTSCFCSWL